MSAPSFSGIPERPKPPKATSDQWDQGGLDASSSSKAAPVFSSFPARPTTKKNEDKDRRRERVRSRSPHADGERRKHKSDRHVRDKEEGSHKSRKSSKGAERDEERDRARRYEKEQDEERRRRKARRLDEAGESGKAKGRAVEKDITDDSKLDKESETQKSFYVDRTGDEGNIRYGGIEPGKIPKYSTRGYGKVVGLPEQYSVARIGKWKEGQEKGIVITDKTLHVGDHVPTLLKPIPEQTFRISSRNRKENKAIADQYHFVALDNGKVRPSGVKSTTERSISSFLLGRDEEPVEEPADEVPLEEDSDDSDDLDEQETPEQIRRRRVIEFEQHLDDSPGDIEQWIAYSSMHLEDFAPGRTKGALGLLADAAATGDPAALKGKKGAYDVALATLERAIKVLPANAYSPKLQLAFFALAQQVWPPGQVTEKWQDVLRMLQESREKMNEKELMDLWLGYISWREGRGLGSRGAKGGVGGGIDDVVDIYAQCIDMMRSRDYPTSEKRTVAEENMVYLLLRCVLLLRHGGYHERGTAICQAMLELTFHAPPDLRADKSSSGDRQHEQRLMQSLEEFWESEVPRIGDNGARGWALWQGANAMDLDVPPNGSTEFEQSTDNDPFVRWFQDETAADRCIRPGKASAIDTAEEDNDDPYRIILFDDIRSFLCVIRNPEVKLQLVYAVLNYLGLPFGIPDLGTNTAFARDPHLQWALAANQKARLALWPENTANQSRLEWSPTPDSATFPPIDFFSSPVKMWLLTEDTAFEDVLAWFNINQAGLQQSVDVAFLRNLFESLAPVVYNRSFQWLRIAFEATCNKKSTAKLCKQLLSHARNNLSLWCTYARVLRSQRKVEEARQVYRMCCSSLDEKIQSSADIEHVFSDWAELEWLAGRHEDLRNILIASVSSGYQIPDGKPSPAMYLKAKQHYWQYPDQSSRAAVVLHYLFLYVSMDFEQAFRAVQTHAASLPSGSSEQEEVLQVGAKIMYRHSQDHIVKADTQRTFLEYAIGLFPSNTMFLSLYFSNEFGTRVYGRLQRLLYETVLLDKEESAASYLWAIWAESMSARRTFWQHGGQGAERVRAMYEKAISSSIGKYSIPLWISYIEFMSAQGRTEPAKRLCYRAIAHLGGCKALYMLPFSPQLRPSFSDKELRDWAELMTEKGLRIRKPFEEYWQGEEESAPVELDDGGDPMAADEAYAAFEDRKRLLPY